MRGCTVTGTFIIYDENGPSAYISSLTNVDCNANCNGIAEVTASGGSGIGTYTYLWNDPLAQISQTATNLCAGPISVSVTDLNGCVVTVDTTITEPLALNANYFVSNNTCNNSCDGYAYVVVTGGTTPYNYQWDDLLLQTTV